MSVILCLVKLIETSCTKYFRCAVSEIFVTTCKLNFFLKSRKDSGKIHTIRRNPSLGGNDQGILGHTSAKPSYRNAQRNDPIHQDTQRGSYPYDFASFHCDNYPE